MKQQRRGIFETNSSSMHSISIYRRGSEFGKIPENATIDWQDFRDIGCGGETELGKLRFCMDLIFSIVYENENVSYREKKSLQEMTKAVINEALSASKNSKLGDIEPDELSDMYSGDKPIEVFSKFIEEELGKTIQGENILSKENITTTITAINKIIFSPEIITVDYEIYSN